jgi:hypothetical protein
MTPPLFVCHLLFLSEYLDDPITNPFDSISISNSNQSRKFQTVRFVSMAVSLGVHETAENMMRTDSTQPSVGRRDEPCVTSAS